MHGGTAGAVERAARGQVRAGVGQARQTRAGRVLELRTAHVIAACHLTALEICYSARNQADLEALLAGQRALEWLPVNEAVMDRALEVQQLLAAHSGSGTGARFRT